MPQPNHVRRKTLQILFPTSKFSHLSEYKVWSSMRQRCRDNPYYSGRISVCEDWDSFLNFLADMGFRPSPEHSIDRIDNDGNYEPENCRWTTRCVQMNNRRQQACPSTKFVIWQGDERLLSDLCKENGLKYMTVKQRLQRGWSLERALGTPVSAPFGSKRHAGSDDRPQSVFRSSVDILWRNDRTPSKSRAKVQS